MSFSRSGVLSSGAGGGGVVQGDSSRFWLNLFVQYPILAASLCRVVDGLLDLALFN